MNSAVVGLFAGMALGFAGWFGGFAAFLLVAAVGAVGYGVGRLADEGRLGELLRPGERKRW
ncbi:hypothetical protein AB0O07_35200 [Streptomyces sp. NPDC093085]|uniref:hypothetical protein n=1 Tax=Streptomyces sp. NPDC093085 TaxID=3155068 RepID=UPI0034263EDC